jgi:hypothetical protein
MRGKPASLEAHTARHLVKRPSPPSEDGYNAAKESVMIELTEEQLQAVERGEQLPVLINPKTREEFVLVRKARFEAMQKWLAPLKRRWDDPADDDLIARP